MNKKDYPYSYDTKNEEFFYRWGLAALFHDVGYPVEIVGRQINRLIDFATDVEGRERRSMCSFCFPILTNSTASMKSSQMQVCRMLLEPL